MRLITGVYIRTRSEGDYSRRELVASYIEVSDLLLEPFITATPKETVLGALPQLPDCE